jgi:iron complex outermembrane receptor protein
MQYKKYPLLFLMILSIVVDAKTSSTLRGRIEDSKKEPVAFANVILLNANDSTTVKGALSNESGSFSFENVEAGNYLVLVSQLGNKFYTVPFPVKENETEKELEKISLPPSNVELGEVQVSALRPFIEHRLDETIVNVENSIINAGGTALDVLRTSPGVTVDDQGNIRLVGKNDVLVMVDGKPTYLSDKDLYELLRNTSSDQISQIVIMTNPSAKYDAAGTSGIINIKMKKKQNMGLNGNARISYGQGVYPDFGTGFGLNYRNEKINVFGGYDFMRAFYFERVTNLRKFIEENYKSEFDQETFDKGGFYSNNFRAGLDYYAGKKNIIGGLIKGNLFNNHDETTANTDILNNSESVDSGYVTENINDSKWNTISANLNWLYKIDTLGSELSADADYAKFDNGSNFKFTTDHFFNDGSPGYSEYAESKQPADIEINSLKIDYVKQLKGKMKLESGAKTSFVTTDNDVKYYNLQDGIAVIDTGKTNHFTYEENINAAYLILSGEVGKWGLKAGLRAEQTNAKGEQAVNDESFKHNYLDLFPSTFVNYNFSDKHQVTASYSRRVDRPGYGELNPFKYFIDPYNFREGNPNLNPQYTNVFELKYVFSRMYSIAFNYSHTDDAMTQIAKQIDSTHTTFITTENLNSNDNYGVNLSVPFQIASWWESNNNIFVYNNSFVGTSSVGEVDKRMTTFTFNSYNSFSIMHGWRAELSGYYTSKALYGTTVSNPVGSVAIGVSKTFLNDRFTLRAQINDIFHTEVTTSVIQYQNIDVNFKRVYDSQFIRLHLMYAFGKKTVARARQRSTGSQDEQNRINTNR